MFSPLAHFGQQFDRTQQINELLVSVPPCRAISPDRSLLEVGVKLQDSTTTALRVTLPAAFPRERPLLSISTPVRHPWVDRAGRLTFPLLERWGAQGVRLASVVQEALKGLGGTAVTPPPSPPPPGGAPPPQQQQQATGVTTHAAGAQQLEQQHSTGAADGSQHGGSVARVRIPPIPSAFPELQQMAPEELAKALAEEGAYQHLVQRVAQRLQLTQGVEQLAARNLEAARANLARQEELAGLRSHIAIVRSSEYEPARAAFDAKYARQRAVLERLAPEVLICKLQEATQAAEEESDGLVQQVQSGEMGVETFVERYTKARATFHQRDLKLQAAQQQLLPQQR